MMCWASQSLVLATEAEAPPAFASCETTSSMSVPTTTDAEPRSQNGSNDIPKNTSGLMRRFGARLAGLKPLPGLAFAKFLLSNEAGLRYPWGSTLIRLTSYSSAQVHGRARKKRCSLGDFRSLDLPQICAGIGLRWPEYRSLGYVSGYKMGPFVNSTHCGNSNVGQLPFGWSKDLAPCFACTWS